VINGDDYHRWPRGHEKWQVYTHLNIRGSDVHRQFEHAVAMYDGRTVVKGVYDHATGRLSHPQEVDGSEYIVFSGLHSLSLDSMRRVFDLKVFLDPDEDLRRRWKLLRDGEERGYRVEEVAQSLDRRAPDRLAYILPQRDTADVLVQLRPGRSTGSNGEGDAPGLVLEVRALNGFDLTGLAEELASVETLSVEHQPYLDSRWQALTLAGSVSGERLREICESEVPNLREIAPRPRFADDVNGLMQTVLLACLSNRLRWGDAGDRG
jgi:uridine kinase